MIPTMSEARRKATYADLLALPEHLVGEILAGEVHTSPRPATPHTTAASTVGGDLNSAFHRKPGGPRGPGGWWILDEPELHLGEDVLVPDLAGWRRERVPEGLGGAALTVVPDWVCEVLSPATGRHDRLRKMPVYARHGVTHAWLIEPVQRTLEVYRRQGEHWLLTAAYGDEEFVRAEPFDAIEVELSRWWLE